MLNDEIKNKNKEMVKKSKEIKNIILNDEIKKKTLDKKKGPKNLYYMIKNKKTDLSST
jgi:hypothetical protein